MNNKKKSTNNGGKKNVYNKAKIVLNLSSITDYFFEIKWFIFFAILIDISFRGKTISESLRITLETLKN